MKRKMIAKSIPSTIDWDATRQRIAALKAELAIENEPPPDALERVWAEHAQLLARIPEQEQTGTRIDLVFVRLGGEVYALEADCVYDIRPAEQITFVPHVPDWVQGVYNLRGYILSVIDLSRFLDLLQPVNQKLEASQSSLVVVKTAEMECAFLVDQVLSIEVLPIANIQPPSELARSLPSTYVRGIVDYNGNKGICAAVLLNLRAIMNDERMVVNQEAV